MTGQHPAFLVDLVILLSPIFVGSVVINLAVFLRYRRARREARDDLAWKHGRGQPVRPS